MLAYKNLFMKKLPTPEQCSIKAHQNSSDVSAVGVDLNSYHALSMWSRWLYGQPMWTRVDGIDTDELLTCLVSIYILCAGRYCDDDKDTTALNACTDAIRSILLTETFAMSRLLQEFGAQLESSDLMIHKLLVDMIAHKKFTGQKKTIDLPQDLEEKYPKFFSSFGLGGDEENDGKSPARLHSTLRIPHPPERVELR